MVACTCKAMQSSHINNIALNSFFYGKSCQVKKVHHVIEFNDMHACTLICNNVVIQT